MRLLVTGGAGFIGSNFIEYERAYHAEDEILCLDLLTYAGRRENLPEEGEKFSFVQGDIADDALVEQIFQQFRPELVVNFAAQSHVDRSIESPRTFLHTNIMGVGVLLDRCRQYPVKRFHQVSTDEVYGELSPKQRQSLFTEQSPLKPSSPYSASKASADLLTLSYARTYGVPVTISRSSNNYGIRQHPEKLVPKMIACARANEPLPIYGSGMQVRDWIAAQDHCRAIDLILRRGKNAEVYNVGAGCELQNIRMAESILAQIEGSSSTICHVKDRPGHDFRYAVDAGKIRRELGWTPQIPFEEGMRQTVRWYLTHPQYLSQK